MSEERCVICGETEEGNADEHDPIPTGVHAFLPLSKVTGADVLREALEEARLWIDPDEDDLVNRDECRAARAKIERALTMLKPDADQGN